MTLNRQLISAISALFLAVLIGIEAIAVTNAQRHFQAQLESIAQDAATSLGLSLGNLLKDRDAALAETVINPVFDRGHYERIVFESLAGQAIVERALPPAEEGDYPRWFAGLFPLTGPSAESLVTAGWRQLGRVRVSVHPRFAYEQLWASARQTVIYMLVIYVASLAALRLILLGVLRPLARVEEAAQEISQRHFVTIESRPRTRELARVVDAINTLSHRVREAFESEARRAGSLQREAYVDPVSGLLNRRGLHEQFEADFGAEGESFAGSLALVEIGALAELNARLGSSACDTLLGAIGEALAAQAREARGLAGRWAGAQFVLSLPGQDAAANRARLAQLRKDVALLVEEAGGGGEVPLHVGAVHGLGRRTLETLVADAGALLERARVSVGDALEVHMVEGAAQVAAQESSVAIVGDAMRARRVVLFGQPALAIADRQRLHTELMARIPRPEGGLIAAGDFLWIVSRHGWVRTLDEIVVEQTLAVLRGGAGSEAIALNLTPQAVESPGFVDWLVEQLRAAPGLAGRLTFELSERGVVHDEATVARLSQRLKTAGAGFAIDHFGLHANSVALIEHLRPTYVKLAPGHCVRLAKDAGTRLFVESVVLAAGHFGIPVIAQNVESEDAVEDLRKLGVAAFQGHLSGKPSPWPIA